MRRYLFLVPLFFLVFAAPRVAEAQSFCSLSGVEWTRCFDFRTSDHGFTPKVSAGTRGTWTAGEHVLGVGWNALPYPGHPNNGNLWRKELRINLPADWPITSITQLKLVYSLTPGTADNTNDWAGIVGYGGASSWTRDELVSSAGTVSANVSYSVVGTTSYVFAQSSQCNSTCTAETIDGSMTLIAVVIGGTEDAPPGEEPSTGGGGGGAPAELVIDVTPLYESISAYIPMFLVLFAIPGGIVIAVSLVRMIVNAVGNAIKSASGNG